MKVLGVHWGYCSTAAVLVDGVPAACVSEERLSGVKNDESFPRRAIASALRTAGVDASGLDKVAVAGLRFHAEEVLTHKWSTFSIQDRVREQHVYWAPKFAGKNPSFLDLFADKLDADQPPGDWTAALRHLREGDRSTDEEFFRAFRTGAIAKHLGVDPAKVVFVPEHAAQAHYARFATAAGGRAAVLTADAWRETGNASVWAASDADLRELAVSDDFVAGLLYRKVTLLLGLRPDEHDVKVMDLAPYAKQRFIQGPLNTFREVSHVDGLGFAREADPGDLYAWLRGRLEGQRFDSIAGGIQAYVEELLCDWARNALTKAKAHRLAVSGSIAMNTKAMLELAKLPEVESLVVPPAPADESLALGACYVVERQSGGGVEPLPHAFLGPAPDGREIADAVNKARSRGWKAQDKPTLKSVVAILRRGGLVGRCVGRSEFGPRALGARSILADPSRGEAVQEINERVKGRDFWIPFSPSILEERAGDYIENPKDLPAPYMTLAFASRPRARTDLRATVHPWDHTLRPHVVSAAADPGYHELLAAFEAETGIGGLLNTSFNVTGNPLAQTPAEAFAVADRCDLDALLLDGTLLERPRGGLA